jgi:hypothetical protein
VFAVINGRQSPAVIGLIGVVIGLGLSFGIVEGGSFFFFIVFVKIEQVGDHVGLDLFSLGYLTIDVFNRLFVLCFLFEFDESLGVKIVFGVDFGPGGEFVFET